MDSTSTDPMEFQSCPWARSTDRATAHVRLLLARQNHQLLEDAERHLLLPYLTQHQQVSLNEHGWCALPWIEQGLLLRLHIDRMPTVDVYRTQTSDCAPSYRMAAGARWGVGPYLCSFDVRYASGEIVRDLPLTASVPSGFVRRVLLAQECGRLAALLQLSGLLHQPIDIGEPDDDVEHTTAAIPFQHLCGLN